MNLSKLAETVLYQIEHFYILQELDVASQREEPPAIKFLDTIYKPRPVQWRDLFPVVRLSTLLGTLFIPFSFIARFTDDKLGEFGFSIKPEYELSLNENGIAADASPQKVLRTLRNAIAHLSDFAAGNDSGDIEPNVDFDSGVLVCRSRNYGRNCELVFNSNEGFIKFLSDLLISIRQAANNIEPENIINQSKATSERG